MDDENNKIKQTHLVWDLPIRLFHWCLVFVLIGLWYSSESDRGLIEIHMLMGYTALTLIVFRIVWGVIGTHHAKFKNFLPSRKELTSYLVDSWRGRAKNYVGHNPLGSLMVFVMILLVLVQAISGLFISDDIFSAGPYNSVVSKEFENFFEFAHHNAFDFILAASVIHILAVLYYVVIKKQPLIKAMLHGRKSVDNKENSPVISNSKLFVAIVTIICVIGIVYWLVILNAPVVEEYYY